MGIVTSKDTRRLSFDNNFSLNTNLDIDEPFQDGNELSLGNKIKNKTKCESVPIKSYEIISKDLPEEQLDYWSQRMESLKTEHQSINKIVEKEYENSLEKYNYYQIPQATEERIQKLTPCLKLESKILKCYEDNPHQTLKCSDLVQSFNECVNKTCTLDND